MDDYVFFAERDRVYRCYLRNMGTVLKIDNGTAGTHQSNIRTTMPMALHDCLSQCHHKCQANVACYILHVENCRSLTKVKIFTDQVRLL